MNAPDRQAADDPADAVPVSVMIFTLNEEIHLPACLRSLDWCEDIMVIDSCSSDGTEALCAANKVRFFQHPFEGFGRQRNWALDHCSPKHDWILILDADERVPPELAQELVRIARSNPAHAGAFRVKRRFYMWGRWLKHSSLYPTWVVRFVHRDRVRYINRGHAETQDVQGEILALSHDLIDENLKGIDEWFERQNRYATQDALYELEQEPKGIAWREVCSADPLVRRAVLKRISYRLPARALLVFIYVYLFRLGFLEGRDGYLFCLMKATYQRMVMIKKHALRKAAESE